MPQPLWRITLRQIWFKRPLPIRMTPQFGEQMESRGFAAGVIAVTRHARPRTIMGKDMQSAAHVNDWMVRIKKFMSIREYIK